MPDVNLDQTFAVLTKLLAKHSAGLKLMDEIPGSTAKEKKAGLHLYGVDEVSIAGRKAQQTYVAGIIRQKSYVGFYHMPVYSHAAEFQLSPALIKARKGKSCFHIKSLNPVLAAELEQLLTAGIKLYRDNGWI